MIFVFLIIYILGYFGTYFTEKYLGVGGIPFAFGIHILILLYMILDKLKQISSKSN